jgi:UDP-N-acetylglucosamine acyltransferase
VVDISRKAKIGIGNKFGKFVIVGDNVTIGDYNEIGDFVSIKGNVMIGANNYFANNVSIGGISNHVIRKNIVKNGRWIPEKNSLSGTISIGNENIIGECVTMHIPVLSDTFVGNRCNLGYHTHVSHDARIEDRVITGLESAIGGYVHLLEGANLGINAMIHPRIVVGQYSMAGVGTVIIRHVLPGSTVVGNPARFIKVNKIGLSRNNFTEEEIKIIVDFLESKEVSLQSIQNEKIHQIYEHFYDLSSKWRDVDCIPFKQ